MLVLAMTAILAGWFELNPHRLSHDSAVEGAGDRGETVLGAGGARTELSYEAQSRALIVERALSLLSPDMLTTGAAAPAEVPYSVGWRQGVDDSPVSDGQFVWGPNVGRFDVASWLRGRGSPLEAYAPEIALWASYSSVNPEILLAALEFRDGLVSTIPSDWDAQDVVAAIEDTSMTMATAYYQHLHTWGDRHPEGRTLSIAPLLRLDDGTLRPIDLGETSGTFALAAFVARFSGAAEFDRALSPHGTGSFESTFGSLFPSVDLQSTANEIDPPGTPPANMLQLPFAMGATWSFGGPHSWNGDSTPPFSSMDFFTGGATCSAPPYLYTVSAAAGTTMRPSNYSCWLEIDHGGGWRTSYYHLRNLAPPASVPRNAALGTIACEICAGGFATGPHVHFSLKYNGAYVSLEGVELTGWTVHVGPQAYNTGSIERDGITLNPWSTVLNDYHTYFGTGVNSSLHFLPGGSGGRVAIPVDDPANTLAGPPVDVGASDDFTIDVWLRALPGENAAEAIACGANDNWKLGNILLDRRRFGGAGYGLSIAGGRIAFGVTGPSGASLTLCGTTDVTDGQWHLITLARNRWDGTAPDGALWLFVDGQLQTPEAAGPGGDISYPDAASPSSMMDLYLVLGVDKYVAGSPSFVGWVDELRFSNIIRSRTSFAAPTAPFVPDSNTLALFRFNEGSGDAIYDTSGYRDPTPPLEPPAGPSGAQRLPAGAPLSPEWSNQNPFAPVPTPTPTATAPTASPTSTAPTASATPTSSSTATSGPSATATPSVSSTATASPSATTSASATTTAAPSDTPTAAPSATPAATSTALPTPTLIPTVTPGGPGLPGDVSLDGFVNIIDVQLCVNVILGSETESGIVMRSDVTGDGSVNVLDAQAIVNIILAG
jgi:hypothetical protein